MLSKMSKTKNVLLNLYSLIKKIVKDSDDFEKKIDFESQILAFLDTSPLKPILKIQLFPLGMLILRKKSF